MNPKLRAAVEYAARMRPYDGDVLLFSARARLAENPANTADGGFGRWARSIEVVLLDGTHHQLLREEPSRSILAASLRARL